MIKKCLTLLFISLVLLNCDSEPSFIIKAESFSDSDLSICDSISCPQISVNYISVSGNSEVVGEINSSITRFIIESLYLGDEAISPSASNISEAATGFIKMYRTHSAEFPDMPMEYFAEINVAESFRSKTLLSISLEHYLFTGGAHGYGATRFVNYDLETGSQIPNDKLFADYTAFERFAEEKFRIAFEIPKEESINATGFWFDNELFSLPEAIGFSETHLILVYNQYEIASYADGAIELEIALDKVEPFLSIPLK